MTRHLLRGLMALAAALTLCGCGDSGHWENVEKTTGYKGKARVNPFLAAERLLKELGHQTRVSKALTKMPAYDGVIFTSGEGGLPEGRAKQLLRWVFSGGHLIYCLDGTRPYNDFETPFGSYISALFLEEEKDPVLQQLGIGLQKRLGDEEAFEKLEGFHGEEADAKSGAGPKDAKEKKRIKGNEEWLESEEEVNWNGRTYQLSLGGFQRMVLKRKLRPGEFSAGSKNDSLALHLQHGMGRVTLLAHARPFRNHWIGEMDHADWLAALVGEYGSREVLFVSTATGSFMGLLWQHGWMAVVTLAVCLLFWLWQQMPRFGPLAEVELDSTRHFASHIGALGEFFWRMRRGPLLVNAARDAVWERVRERLRPLDDGSRQMSDHLAEEIARRSGLPAKRVAAALDVAPPDSAHNFVLLMRDLQAIRRAL
ncbi:DUF4350 domain-containing protein [Prosthecobacter sp.]|uniref:DUF4350 domain-containing protein n=1 Tax=Prosthecobacter sp. TaxID=1965333 RepID=UPI003784BCFE